MKIDNFYNLLLENDLNPFVLFNSNGKMKDFNKEAEFLFNNASPKELYELAVSHASLSFGFNRKFISLKYGKSSYYAILVGYINDDEIALRLYKEVSTKDELLSIQDIELVNIFSLIELSKSTTLLQSDVIIKEIYDVSIPEIKININQFLLTLNECFELFKDNKSLDLRVYIKIGEYEMINEKKYQVASIEFVSNDEILISKSLTQKALKAHINIFIDNHTLTLDFPIIL